MDFEQSENQGGDQEAPIVNEPTVEAASETHETINKKLPLRDRFRNFFANKKKRLTFFICFGILILVIIGVGIYFLRYKNSGESAKTASTGNQEDNSVAPAETLYQAPLDGLMVSKDASLRHPLAIVVENHVDARPQAGLDKASVVYEALAEGGITRFLGIFGSNEADKVGPVRSARTYFVDWAHGFSAYLAHVGGNIDALDQIAAEKTLDLDQFRYSAPYWREYRAGLASEHTMYTSTAKLRDQAATNKYTTANNFSVYKFKDDPTGAEQIALPESQKITIDYSSSSYKVEYDFDKATDSYKRLLAGKAETDQVTKDQLNPKCVIIMTVASKSTTTRINEPGLTMTTTGSGAAKIFIDGKMIQGTWKKDSAASREIFYDADGNEVVFNRGQLWISVVPPVTSVTVQ